MFKNKILEKFPLKIISLGLAVICWVYINNEVAQSKKKEKITLVWDKELNLEIRELPIRANIKGSPPRGYSFLDSKLVIKPSTCKVVGKKIVLDSLEFVETEPIDLKNFNKTTVVKTYLRPFLNVVIPEREVELTIPIEKIKR